MKIAILGGGESGSGAAILAKARGHEVFLSDKGTIADKYKQWLQDHAIPYEEGQHSPERLLDADWLVKSPGIPDKAELVQAAKAKGIPVMSEIEFAGRYTDAFIIGITGSNGKTTATKLTHHLLCEAGIDAGLGGNIGESFAKMVAEAPKPVYVLEISSFQLDDIDTFRPDVAVLLNITPDHLDRYEYRLENYARAKFRITMAQKAGDSFIYNADDPISLRFLPEAAKAAKRVAIKKAEHYAKPLTVKLGGQAYDLRPTVLRGRHNMLNAACAIQAALLAGARPERIQAGLESFVNFPHRLEMVRHVHGIDFINDSKATNVDAVFYALEAMEKPVVWIVGGTDKGNDYGPLLPLVQEKVNAIICIGVDNSKLREAFYRHVPSFEEADNMALAVQRALAYAEQDEVVLLSPACASFDRFKNYEDRGQQFKAAVMDL